MSFLCGTELFSLQPWLLPYPLRLLWSKSYMETWLGPWREAHSQGIAGDSTHTGKHLGAEAGMAAAMSQALRDPPRV